MVLQTNAWVIGFACVYGPRFDPKDPLTLTLLCDHSEVDIRPKIKIKNRRWIDILLNGEKDGSRSLVRPLTPAHKVETATLRTLPPQNKIIIHFFPFSP